MFDACQAATPQCVARDGKDGASTLELQGVEERRVDQANVVVENGCKPISPGREEVVRLDEDESYEALYADLDEELQRSTKEVLVRASSAAIATHEKVRTMWSTFWVCSDLEEFRGLAMSPAAARFARHRTPVYLYADLACTKQGYGFGVHQSKQDHAVLFVDRIVANSPVDSWNRAARERAQACLHPCAAILSVNDVAGDCEAMKEELKHARETRLLFVNPPGVEEAVAVIDYLRSGDEIKSPFWHSAVKWEENAVSPTSSATRSASTFFAASGHRSNLGTFLGQSTGKRPAGREQCLDTVQVEGDCRPVAVDNMCGLGGRRPGKTAAV